MLSAYNCSLLEFVENIEKADEGTGELYHIYKRKYLNLSFSFILDSQKIFKKLTVRGSVHTFYNNGLHNANVMSFRAFTTTLDKYYSLFGIDLTKCKLHPLEYGTNLYLSEFSDYNVDEIIQYTFCVKRKMFSYNGGIDTSLISGTRNNEVRIKFYSKSADYPKYCNNALRIEDKLTKSRGLTKKGIVFVSDLYDVTNHIILLEKHLENLSNIVLFDYTINIPRNSKYAIIARRLNSSDYWRKLIKECRKKQVYDTKYNDEVALLNMLSEKYGTNMLQKLMQYVEKQTLTALGVCDFNKFDIIKTPKNALLKKPKNAQLHIPCIPNAYNINYVSKLKKINQLKKCLITGVDISNQKKDSFLLAINSLKNLYKTDKIKFDEVKSKYLSKKWIDDDLEKQLFEIYHNIRNTINNQRIKQKKLYPPHQKQLFNINP